ncbi:MAG: PAS domain-containing sensor histidine kinase [Bacillota bacterium]
MTSEYFSTPLHIHMLIEMMDHSYEPMYITRDGKIIYANKTALELLKYDHMDEIQFKNAVDFIHEKYQDMVQRRSFKNIGEVLVSESKEVKLLCSDGSLVDVEMKSLVFSDHDDLLVMTLLKEIEKSSIGADKALYSLEFINTIFDSIIDGIFVSGSSGNLIGCNERFSDMFNIPRGEIHSYTEDELLDQLLNWFSNDNCRKQLEIAKVALVNNYIDRLKLRDGKVLYLYVCPLIEKGEVSGKIWSFRDITAQAQAEEALNKSNVELEDALLKLKKTQARLVQQEKLVAIGQLSAGVAHEINNPLSFVISNMGILQDYIDIYHKLHEVYDSSIEKMQKLYIAGTENPLQDIHTFKKDRKVDFIGDDLTDIIDDIGEGLERVRKIVISLRNFSREAKSEDFDIYDLNQGIQDTLNIAQNEIKQYAQIIQNFSDIPKITANGGEINQVILNMLLNAIYAIKTKNSGDGQITLRTYIENGFVLCEIKDNGIGIEEKDIANIFNPFFTTKKVGEGTGLGLSVSYDIIVNKHGGFIEVESTPMSYTKFTIRLPINKE